MLKVRKWYKEKKERDTEFWLEEAGGDIRLCCDTYTGGMYVIARITEDGMRLATGMSNTEVLFKLSGGGIKIL